MAAARALRRASANVLTGAPPGLEKKMRGRFIKEEVLGRVPRRNHPPPRLPGLLWGTGLCTDTGARLEFYRLRRAPPSATPPGLSSKSGPLPVRTVRWEEGSVRDAAVASQPQLHLTRQQGGAGALLAGERGHWLLAGERGGGGVVSKGGREGALVVSSIAKGRELVSRETCLRGGGAAAASLSPACLPAWLQSVQLSKALPPAGMLLWQGRNGATWVDHPAPCCCPCRLPASSCCCCGTAAAGYWLLLLLPPRPTTTAAAAAATAAAELQVRQVSCRRYCCLLLLLVHGRGQGEALPLANAQREGLSSSSGSRGRRGRGQGPSR